MKKRSLLSFFSSVPPPGGPRVLQPRRAHTGKSRPSLPDCQPTVHCFSEKVQHEWRRDRYPVLSKMGYRSAEVHGMRGEIEPDADHDRELTTPARALEQDAASLCGADHHVVRPLEPQPWQTSAIACGGFDGF